MGFGQLPRFNDTHPRSATLIGFWHANLLVLSHLGASPGSYTIRIQLWLTPKRLKRIRYGLAQPAETEPEENSMSKKEDRTAREFIVAADGVSIPMFDMAPPGLFGGFKKSPQPTFAVESKRLMRVESAQLQERILTPLREIRAALKPLGYQHNFYGSLPAVGAVAIGILAMSTKSGQNYFFAVRTATRRDNKVVQTGFIGFGSLLGDDDSLLTLSPVRLPKPREGVDREILRSEDPEHLLREHRKRMREYTIQPLEATELVNRIRRQNELDCNEYLEQGLLRKASPGQIAAIRAK